MSQDQKKANERVVLDRVVSLRTDKGGDMTDKLPYKWGDRVLFIAENQHEISGIVRGVKDNKEGLRPHLYLLIELDHGGYYHAKIDRAN